MIGKYKGYYKYDSLELQKQIKHDQTFFILEITEFENGQFNGFVEDDLNTGGTPGRGIVKGVVENNDISFIKEMPVASILLNGEQKTFNKKHPKIYYKGMISEDKMEGVWKIKMSFKKYGLMFLIGAKTTGSWVMTKI